MEKPKPKGASRWAQDALFVQSACNASGIARSLAELLSELCRADDDRGTDWRNSHPCVVLFVTQLAYLSGVAKVADIDTYHRAYAWCSDVASGKRSESWSYDRTSRTAA
jgi:hypothetical protein